jgi:ribosome maturation factor RimP
VTRSTGKPVVGKLVSADEENLTLTLKGNAGDVVVPRSEVLVAKVDVQI